jgi:hypothetical protein
MIKEHTALGISGRWLVIAYVDAAVGLLLAHEKVIQRSSS